jgi:hypothetical protein
MAKMPSSERVITGEGRASYAFVFTPSKNQRDEDKYRLVLLLPKANTEEIKRLKAIALQVGIEAFGPTFAELVKAGRIRWPFRDGDLEKPGDPNYSGHVFLGANQSADKKPQVLAPDGKTLLESPEQFGSGDYCRISGRFFAYENSGNKGVSFSLGNVQLTRKGERLDNRVEARTEFDAIPGAESFTPGGTTAADDFDL